MALIDEKMARKKAEHLLNTTHLEQALNGINNWVYFSKDKVISIPKNPDIINYSIRVSAIHLLSQNGIKTTEIIDHGNHRGIEYLITCKTKGKNITLNELSENQMQMIHRTAARTLKEIQSLRTQNFGRLDADLVGAYNTWRLFVEAYFDDSLRLLRKNENLWNEFGKSLEKEFENKISICDNTKRSSLLHGDYHLGNLLFNGEELDIVTDLDMVTSGDPAWDVAYYIHTTNIEREKCIDIFKETYGRDTIEKEKFYSMIIWSRKISVQAINRPNALKESIPELRSILKR